MKILMTTDCVGGVWTYAMDLIQELARYDVEVVLASMGRKLSEHQASELASLVNVNHFESEYRLEWMENPWEDVWLASRWLLELRDHVQPDIIHLNNFAHGDLDWHLPLVMVGHSCVFSWMASVQGCLPDASWTDYRQRVQRGLLAADVIVAPSQYMLNELDRFYGPLGSECDTQVIHNGRTPVIAEKVAREPFILSAGRLWDEAKNMDLLATIADHVHWPILVAGQTEHPDGHGHRESGNLRLLGQLSPLQLRGWMERASIYALPAKYEPFGLSALEAAMAGCPLVLGDIESLREVWADAALYEPTNSPQNWIRQLNALIEDKVERTRLGAAACRHASRYTSEKMAAQYHHVYRRMLAQPAMTPASRYGTVAK